MGRKPRPDTLVRVRETVIVEYLVSGQVDSAADWPVTPDRIISRLELETPDWEVEKIEEGC